MVWAAACFRWAASSADRCLSAMLSLMRQRHWQSRDRKKLISGVRVRLVVKSTELMKFKLAIFLKNQELVKFKVVAFQKIKNWQSSS